MAADETRNDFNPNNTNIDPDDAAATANQGVLNAGVTGNDAGPAPDGTGSIGAGNTLGGGGGAVGEEGSAGDTTVTSGSGTGGAASSGGASGGGTAGGTASTGSGAISDPA